MNSYLNHTVKDVLKSTFSKILEEANLGILPL